MKSIEMDQSNEDLPVYCICKSPDIERFMIMCDECEEWYVMWPCYKLLNSLYLTNYLI